MAVKNIGIFGKRNAGKSSLINLLVGQDVAIVSSIAGTTNDPVKKRIEIPGIGICTLIDTAGIDDAGDLGNLRIKKSLQIADQIDMAIVLYTANMFDKEEVSLMKLLAGREIPVLIIHNQSDIMPLNLKKAKLLSQRYGTPIIDFSCCEMNVEKQTEALEKLISAIKSKLESQTKTIMHGLVKENGVYLLICPIDEEAPKERLILPQVMAIRDILDNNATAVVLRPGQLSGYLKANLNGNVGEGAAEKSNNNQVENFSKIELIVTDSSVFGEVTKIIDSLKPGDEVLIMESCTHHVRCADIGRVRLPAMLPKGLKYHFVSGLDEIPGLGEGEKIHYSLAIQCGGCMATAKQIHNRVQQVIEAGVPITNFGMAIAYVTDILKRVTII